MNLVVVAASPELAEQWVPIVDDVRAGVPARAIVVGLDPDGGRRARGRDVSAVCTPAQRRRAGRVLRARHARRARRACAPASRAASRSLCLTDVPTTLVWLGRVHTDDPAFAPLAREAGRIVLDAAQGSLASLANVVYWARARRDAERPGVADLAWTRLAPWQELCARMFDEPRLRALASRVTRLTLVQASDAGAPSSARRARSCSGGSRRASAGRPARSRASFASSRADGGDRRRGPAVRDGTRARRAHAPCTACARGERRGRPRR